MVLLDVGSMAGPGKCQNKYYVNSSQSVVLPLAEVAEAALGVTASAEVRPPELAPVVVVLLDPRPLPMV